MLTAVYPLPSHKPPANSPRAPSARFATSSGCVVLYEADVIESLARIHTRRTLAAELCQRLDDDAFNAALIAFTQAPRVVASMHGITAINMVACLLLCLVADESARTAISCIAAATGTLFVAYTGATLCWDMVCLIVATFEFWFLFAITAFSGVLWCVLLRDIRSMAFISLGTIFTTTLFIDANIYTRHLLVRMLVVGSPGILSGLTFAVLGITPDLYFERYNVLGMSVDFVDILTTGNLTLAYFTAGRVFRSRHLIISRGTVASITCDIVLPVCQLLPMAPCAAAAHPQAKPHDVIQRLRLVDDPSFRGIDLSHALIPVVVPWVEKARTNWNWLGLVGIASCCGAMVWHTSDLVQGLTTTLASRAFALEVVALVTTLVFVFVQGAHYQRPLLRRVLVEPDAWYVAFQLNVIAYGFCDLVRWDLGRLPFVLTVWLWCLWAMFVDALPPTTRCTLGFSHHLTVLVNVMLLLYPMCAGYWLYFSTARASLRNRVLLDFEYYGLAVRVDMLGVLASKLFTLWVWMGRFLWRELRRPHDAFKLIKRRVYLIVDA